MPIKFVCRCGKRLRAQSQMAGRRSACPRCGAPVGVPSLEPTVRGATLGPMSPAERLQSRLAARPTSEALNSKSEKAGSAAVSDFGCRISDFGSDTTADTVFIQQPKRPLAIGLVLQVKHRRWGLKELERH